jgi:hypothetical protein
MNDNERFSQMARESNEGAQRETSSVGAWMIILILMAATGIAYAAAS